MEITIVWGHIGFRVEGLGFIGEPWTKFVVYPLIGPHQNPIYSLIGPPPT